MKWLLPRPVSASELLAPACGGSGFLCRYSERHKSLLKMGADPLVAGESVQKAQLAPGSIDLRAEVAITLERGAGQGTLLLFRLSVSWMAWVRMRKYMEWPKPCTRLPLVPPWREQFPESWVLALERHAGRAGVNASWSALL